MEAYEGMYKSAKIRVEYKGFIGLSSINLVINGKLSDTVKCSLKDVVENKTLQSVIVIDGEELVVVAKIKTAGRLIYEEPEVYVGNSKIPMIRVS
ncbi:MAG: hypothetical protein SPG48_03505 [Treponema sp.]|nr:hypothetical protein [Treponema sp.]